MLGNYDEMLCHPTPTTFDPVVASGERLSNG